LILFLKKIVLFYELLIQYIGAREPYRPRDSRRLHDALIYQSQERSRAQQISRLQNSLAELQVNTNFSKNIEFMLIFFSIPKFRTVGGVVVVAVHRLIPLVDMMWRIHSKILDKNGYVNIFHIQKKLLLLLL